MEWLRQHAGTLASSDIPPEFLAAPPRDSNDAVYKHIQQANMDRFDAIKNGQAVGVQLTPTEAARNHHLRHVTKRQSLRSVSDDDNSSYMPSVSQLPVHDHSLRHKKAFVPQKAPIADSPDTQRTIRSVSGSHSLRHEKRPLSGAGRPLRSNENSPSLSQSKGSPPTSQKPPLPANPTPQLRHSSLPVHLKQDARDNARNDRPRQHALRRSSREYRLENKPAVLESKPAAIKSKPAPVEEPTKHKDYSTIVETTSITAPHLLGLSHNRDRSMGTPMSASANSDRTEMEVCEAQNVALYPHSNDSLLLVQNGPKPLNKDKPEAAKPVKEPASNPPRRSWAQVAAQPPPPPAADPPSIAVNGKSIHTVKSPLTDPREAPAPPVINFIPPTPSHDESDEEIERAQRDDDEPDVPQRRSSLAKRARRYSDVLVRPLIGRTLVTRNHNIKPAPTMTEKREDEMLHPNWVPTSFWEEEDEEDFYDLDGPPEPLPAGGDTSEHPRNKFPRSMSVRMPGFRGSGGFLLGNSLGMDRHGTNKRRPHVTPRSDSTPSFNTSLQRVPSTESASSRGSGEGRVFSIPGTRTKLQYVGFKPITERMKKRRETKEDAARERRRAELKDQIGMRIVHDA
ncbi:hypothetical protein WHR41_06050 [Cladosporium halotolerans]|uniref:Uncharacterized protein n=1 Tax=Cladosporium halotolerans TaxID=1052096 RepID=A0AB34KQ32_9PEZI